MAKGKNFTPSWHMEVGLNHTPAYQVSGIPFASGAIDASSATVEISFPFVTRWVEVINRGTTTLKVGFSANGLLALPGGAGPNPPESDYKGNSYFEVLGSGSSGRLEVKISKLYLNGGQGAKTSVVAGLT